MLPATAPPTVRRCRYCCCWHSLAHWLFPIRRGILSYWNILRWRRRTKGTCFRELGEPERSTIGGMGERRKGGRERGVHLEGGCDGREIRLPSALSSSLATRFSVTSPSSAQQTAPIRALGALLCFPLPPKMTLVSFQIRGRFEVCQSDKSRSVRARVGGGIHVRGCPEAKIDRLSCSDTNIEIEREHSRSEQRQ